MQLDLIEAAARRDLGMARAQLGAERKEPGWTENAVNLLRAFADRQDEPFLAETFVRHCEGPPGLLPAPKDGRAWGPVFQVAARRGFVVRAGYAPAVTSNLSPKPLWRRA